MDCSHPRGIGAWFSAPTTCLSTLVLAVSGWSADAAWAGPAITAYPSNATAAYLPQQDAWPPAKALQETPGAVAQLPVSVTGKKLGNGNWKLRFEFSPSDYDEAAPKKVSLAGTFNGWNRDSVELKKTSAGKWRADIELPEGRHLYKFVLDDTRWYSDPRNEQLENDGHGGDNSVLRLGLRAQMEESSAQIGDGKIAVHALEHDSKSSFFLQPVGDGKVLVRYRSLSHDVDKITLHLRGQKPLPMTSAMEGPL